MADVKKPAGPKKVETGRFKLYKDGKAANRNCPKCGPGYFLAMHKDRDVCGKCGYMEIKTKK